jgi:hypothetical protein
MKRLALATAITAALAAPAFADSHAASFAVMHFNMFADNASELLMEPAGDGPVTMQLVPGSTLAEVFAQLNMDADVAMDVSGQTGVTIIMSDPAHAEEIFRRLMRADDSN